MRKCYTCKRDAAEEEFYESHKAAPNPSCKTCIKDRARLYYRLKRAKGRVIPETAPDRLFAHNETALRAAVKLLNENNPVVVPIHLIGCAFPVPDGLTLRSDRGHILARAKVSPLVIIHRDLGYTTLAEMSGLLAKRGIKILYGTE